MKMDKKSVYTNSQQKNKISSLPTNKSKEGRKEIIFHIACDETHILKLILYKVSI